jgi:CBS domain-containing membrane protein
MNMQQGYEAVKPKSMVAAGSHHAPTPPATGFLRRDMVEEDGRAHHVFALLNRLRLNRLLLHFHPTHVWAAYVFLNGFLTVALLAALAALTHNPFIFPSLGPTAYLLFFTPLAEASAPRNAICGHAVGLLCGYGSYWLTQHASAPDSHGELFWPKVLAAALSLALTGALLVLLRIHHPPAGSTTLMVSLGMLSKPEYLGIIEVAVVLLVAQAFVINTMAGLPYPVWRAKTGVNEGRLPSARSDRAMPGMEMKLDGASDRMSDRG